MLRGPWVTQVHIVDLPKPILTHVMRHTLYRSLFALLLPASWSSTYAQQQAMDCGACDNAPMNCTIAELNAVGILTPIPNPCVGGTQVSAWGGGSFTFIQMNTTIGAEYEVSICGAAMNTRLWIYGDVSPFPKVERACDDDGCGTPGGPSRVRFRATATMHRVGILNATCTATGTTANVTYSCVDPTPLAPPSNDNPCGAIDLPILGSGCITPVVGTLLGATYTGNMTPPAGPPNTGYYDPGAAVASPFAGCGTFLPPLAPAATHGLGYTYGQTRDVWFRVVVPPSRVLGLETTESTTCAGGLALYRAPTCSSAFAWASGNQGRARCSVDGLTGPGQPAGMIFDARANCLAAGDTLFVRYWERGNNELGAFTICAYDAVPPTNDDPCGAITLTPSTTCTPVEFSTQNATPNARWLTVDAPGCGVVAGTPAQSNALIRDLWFQVTVPTGGMTVTTEAGTLTDMAMAFYRPSTSPAPTLCAPPPACTAPPGAQTQWPGSLQLVTGSCADNQSAANRMPRVNLATTPSGPLVVGETIYIRVWNRPTAQFNYSGTFRICVVPKVPPVNDNPCGAIPLDVNADCLMMAATNENATTTGTSFLPGASTAQAPSCGITPASTGPATDDVWFTVDVPGDMSTGNGVIIDTDTLGTNQDMAMAVYRDISGTGCPTLLQLQQIPGACTVNGHGGTSLMPKLTLTIPTNISAGERVYVRVWRQAIAAPYNNQGPFGICAKRISPPKCQGTYYDSGGPNAPYANSENFSYPPLQFCPEKVGDVVTLTFSQFSLETGWDFMYIYNGSAAIPANLIGTYTGTNSPGTISSTDPSGCLFVRFTSDAINTAPGYAFKVSCAPPAPAPPGCAGPPCCTTIYDPGGPGGNYATLLGVQSAGIAPWSQTYCPFNGNGLVDSVITITFSSFNVEGTFDGLYAYDDDVVNHLRPISSGNGPQATWSGPYNPPPPPNGAFWGTALPPPITATISGANPGCITLQLYSDGLIEYSGWTATITCGPPPPPPPNCGDPVCNTTFYETSSCAAGSGTYANNLVPTTGASTTTQTFCAGAGQLLTVTFDQFALENNWDKMYVFDQGVPLPASGPGPFPTMISSGNGPGFGPAPYGAGGYWGFSPPGPFTTNTPGGCLTFAFSTDASVQFAGWRARTSCMAQLPNDNPWNTTGTCTPPGASLLTPQTSCVLTAGTNVGATTTPAGSVPSPGCGNFTGGDVWYRFVAPPSGRVYIDSKAGSLTDAAMALYSGTNCMGPFTLVECDDDDGEGLMPAIDRMCNPLTPGATYWIRVWGYNNRRGTFDICVVEGGGQTTLQNDCGGAFSLCNATPFSGIAYGNGCGPDITASNWGCLAGERQGSWYAFRTNAAGNLSLTITPSTPADIDWAIWSGSFGTPPATPVGTSCMPSGAPVRCSFGSLTNTMTVGGANPTAATGMGRATFVGPAAFNGASETDATDGWVPGLTVGANQMYLLFIDDHHLDGTPYNVSWIESPASVIGCQILPVADLFLQAQPNGSVVDLAWSTTTERNSSHFVIERSSDGVHFTAIGSTEAIGQSSTTTNYQSVDRDPKIGLNYYRLQQVDVDGTATHSNVVSVLFQPRTATIMVVPNPARHAAELLLSEAYDGDLQVRITDGSGRTVGTFLAPSGMQRMDLPIAHLEAGSYAVVLFAKDGPYARTRFVKQ